MPDAPDTTSAKIRRCSVCGYYNPPAAANCQNCGTPFTAHSAVRTRTQPVDGETLAMRLGSRPDGPGVAGTTKLCQRCGHMNPARSKTCIECGKSLQGSDPTDMMPAVSKGPLITIPSTSQLRAAHLASGDHFEDNMLLRFEIGGNTKPVDVALSGEAVIGRRDPTLGGSPDVDLTLYDGYRLGISRRHAALRLRDRVIDLRDLGSSNGTFVNGVQLTPHQPQALHNGDEVILGKLVTRVYFVPKGR